MIWRIILWGSLIWLPYLMYRVLGGEAKFTKNIVVGVTMPFEAHEDAEVCRRLAKFKKELGIVCAVLTAAVVPCMFIRSVSLSMTLYLTWADVCIVIPYIPYLRCNRDLKRIKRSRGWAAERGDTRTVDLKAIQEPHGISAWCFVPAIALALLPLVSERVMWAIYAAMQSARLRALPASAGRSAAARSLWTRTPTSPIPSRAFAAAAGSGYGWPRHTGLRS